MKIVIVGEAYPYHGNVSRFNHNLARQLIKEGNDVEIMTYTLKDTKGSQLSGDESPKDLKITRMINCINPFSWEQSANYIKKSKANEVIFAYAGTRKSVCMGHIAQRLNSTKRIAIIKNIIPENANIFDKLLPYNFARNIDGFVCVTKGIGGDIEHFERQPKPKKYSQMPFNYEFGELMPREEALEYLNLDPDYRYLLFFGYIRPYKGLDLLLRAFADQRLRQHNVKLIIAGELRDKLQPYINIIHELELEDFLEMRTEYIDNLDISRYFSACDMVVQTYKKSHESGVTQLSFYYEKPVLVTNVQHLAEAVTDKVVGYVVEPEEKPIADAILDFYENNRQAEYENNVKAYKKNFSWSNLTKAINSLFENE